MFEVALGAVLTVLCIANLALWLKLTSCYDALTQIIKSSDDFKEKMPNLDEINDEINNTLADFVSNLHIPTAADHLMGGVSNLLQMWGMRRFGNPQEMLQQQLSPDLNQQDDY